MRITFEIASIVFYLMFHSAIAKKGRVSAPRVIENEVFDKNQIVVKFPKNTLPVNFSKKETTISRRKINTMVQPIEENCSTQTFKNELTQLRQKIKCEPRDTVVDLIPPFGAMLTPNAVVVKRCGGMCHGSKKCIPTESRDVKFYVKTVTNNQIDCSSIMVSEDTKCKCDCVQKPQDCNANQVYHKGKCACVCRNENDLIRCIQHSNENFQWDETTCSCVCQQSKLCTTGTYWNEKECRCIKLSS